MCRAHANIHAPGQQETEGIHASPAWIKHTELINSYPGEPVSHAWLRSTLYGIKDVEIEEKRLSKQC